MNPYTPLRKGTRVYALLRLAHADEQGVIVSPAIFQEGVVLSVAGDRTTHTVLIDNKVHLLGREWLHPRYAIGDRVRILMVPSLCDIGAFDGEITHVFTNTRGIPTFHVRFLDYAMTLELSLFEADERLQPM